MPGLAARNATNRSYTSGQRSAWRILARLDADTETEPATTPTLVDRPDPTHREEQPA